MMKVSKGMILVFILIALFVFSTVVYAADALYRFMHNDHIALIIGEVVVVEEKSISVKVEKNIISAKDLNVSEAVKQVKISTADIKYPFDYMFYNSEKDGAKATPALGDYILISLAES